MTKPDVIILGAGVIGLSTALQLMRRSNLSVRIFERASSLGAGSTGASSAVCRHRYTHDEVVRLAKAGIDCYRAWGVFTELAAPLAGFNAVGALWLGAGDEWTSTEVERLGAFGIPCSHLEDDDIKRRFPGISPSRVIADPKTGELHESAGVNSHFFEESAGFMDPQDVLLDLQAALLKRGIEIEFNTHVTKVNVSGGHVRGVVLENGHTVDAPLVVNCSGPWCNALLETVGLTNKWPLVPTRIQVIHLARPPEVVGDLPVCVDLEGGVYFRPQNRGQQLVAGSTREEDEAEQVEDPDQLKTWIDDDFVAKVMHTLYHRVPGLKVVGKVQGYSGLYTVNQTDMHPVVGQTPVDGFFVANGFSGHGFKLAPAIGSLLAQTITDTRLPGDTDIDPAFLGWDREPLTLDAKNVLA